jgi:hypothetical protein
MIVRGRTPCTQLMQVDSEFELTWNLLPQQPITKACPQHVVASCKRIHWNPCIVEDLCVGGVCVEGGCIVCLVHNTVVRSLACYSTCTVLYSTVKAARHQQSSDRDDEYLAAIGSIWITLQHYTTV